MEGLSSRMMVGAHLFPDEIDRFKRLVNILHENAFKLASSRQKQHLTKNKRVKTTKDAIRINLCYFISIKGYEITSP